MLSSNYFTAIDNLVSNAIRGHVLFAALEAHDAIRDHQSEIDLHDNIESNTDLGKRIWIEPGTSDPDMEYSSGSTRFVRRYRIGYGNDNMKLEEIRDLERDLIRAFWLLVHFKQPDGSPIVHADFLPLEIQSIKLGGGKPEPDPIDDPESWFDEMPLTVMAFASTAALGSSSPVGGPSIIAASTPGPGFIDLTYSEPILLAGSGALPPWAIEIEGFLQTAITATLIPPNSLSLAYSVPGTASPKRRLSYTPPPDNVTSLTGVPAVAQLDIPIIPSQ